MSINSREFYSEYPTLRKLPYIRFLLRFAFTGKKSMSELLSCCDWEIKQYFILVRTGFAYFRCKT